MDRDAFTVKWNNCILTASDDAELLRDLDAVIHDAIATELEAQARRMGREAEKNKAEEAKNRGQGYHPLAEYCSGLATEGIYQAAKLERRAAKLRQPWEQEAAAAEANAAIVAAARKWRAAERARATQVITYDNLTAEIKAGNALRALLDGVPHE